MKRAIGAIVFILIWAGSILASSSAAVFIDFPTLVVLVGSTAGLTLLSYRKGMDREGVLVRVKRYSLYSGWMAFITGLIVYFSQADGEINLKAVAVCLIGLFYGYMASVITDCFIQGHSKEVLHR